MNIAKLNRDFESAHRRYHALPERSEKRLPLEKLMIVIRVKQLKAAMREERRQGRE